MITIAIEARGDNNHVQTSFYYWNNWELFSFLKIYTYLYLPELKAQCLTYRSGYDVNKSSCMLKYSRWIT